jgi:hypothetical protein
MQRVAPNPAQTRVPPKDPDSTLRLALLLVFPTIGLEQLLHTSSQALSSLPLYEVLHWLSDSLLALPLAVVAVWGGRRLAGRLGLGAATLSDLVARAALIAILFALTLVPGAVLHDAADRLTHAHTTLAIHSHAPVAQATQTLVLVLDGAAVTNFVVHGLGDGFAGQAIALPLMVLAMWEVRKQRDQRRAQRVWISGQREG